MNGYYLWSNLSKSKTKTDNKQIRKIVQDSYYRNHRICGLNKFLGDVKEKFPYCSSKYQKFLKENKITCAKNFSVL